MSTTFFISDTHFHHKRICEFEPIYRPFTCVEEMNEFIVDSWNSTVGQGDKIYHLGDVSFQGGLSAPLEIVDRLKGKKRLILGNHDTQPVEEYAKYFEKIYGSYNFHNLWLTHIPMHQGSVNQARVRANIHGHIHSQVIMEPKYINVCVEILGFVPISMDEIKEIIDEQ